MRRVFVSCILIAVALLTAVSCGGTKENDNDTQIMTFLSGVSLSYDSLVSASIRRVQEVLPRQSCVVYVTDISCSSCVAQIIKDLVSMAKLESELDVWIMSNQDANTMLAEYYLTEKKEDFGLVDMKFKYYVVPDIVLDNVESGLYLFREGRAANFLHN